MLINFQILRNLHKDPSSMFIFFGLSYKTYNYVNFDITQTFQLECLTCVSATCPHDNLILLCRISLVHMFLFCVSVSVSRFVCSPTNRMIVPHVVMVDNVNMVDVMDMEDRVDLEDIMWSKK